MHTPRTPLLLLRLGVSLIAIIALGGVGPRWLPTAAIAVAIVLSILTLTAGLAAQAQPRLQRL